MRLRLGSPRHVHSRRRQSFGVAVTKYEDAAESGTSFAEIGKAETELESSLREVTALIERLRAKRSSRSPYRVPQPRCPPHQTLRITL